jgi:hypothetical protein
MRRRQVALRGVWMALPEGMEHVDSQVMALAENIADKREEIEKLSKQGEDVSRLRSALVAMRTFFSGVCDIATWSSKANYPLNRRLTLRLTLNPQRSPTNKPARVSSKTPPRELTCAPTTFWRLLSIRR